MQRRRLTKVIPCKEDGMRHFRELDTETKILLSKGGYRIGQIGTQDNDCFSCIESWKYWLNPFNWSANIWNSTRIVMSVIMLIGSLCILGLLIKICMCFKCCCSSWSIINSCYSTIMRRELWYYFLKHKYIIGLLFGQQ